MKLVLFDFDGTIYRKDSFFEFCKFVFRKKPLRIVFSLIHAAIMIPYFCRLMSAKTAKNGFMLYLWNVKPEELNQLLNEFWEREYPESFRKSLLAKISQYRQQGAHLVCVSASPDILLQDICSRIGFDRFIGTRMERKGGRYVIQGNNCHGPEKVVRIRELYKTGEHEILAAYSDSLHDMPMLQLAREHYMIRKNDE